MTVLKTRPVDPTPAEPLAPPAEWAGWVAAGVGTPAATSGHGYRVTSAIDHREEARRTACPSAYGSSTRPTAG